jgi:hypothetical protein
MRQLFSKADLRDLSLIMAIVMLLASVPANAGLVVVSGPSRPELTVNICQPIQMLDRVSNTLLARPATVMPEFIVCHLGWIAPKEAVRLADCKVAPDTPPPKRAV